MTLVSSFMAHKGGIAKSTCTQHAAELADEKGKKTLVVAVDDQIDIVRALMQGESPAEGDAWPWGRSSHVWTSTWDELDELDFDAFDLVLIDLPARASVPPVKLDAAFVLNENYASVVNNMALCERLAAAGVPTKRLAWGFDPALLRWAKAEGVEYIPSNIIVRASLELARPVWSYSQEPFVFTYKEACDGWLAWIENPNEKSNAVARTSVRRATRRRSG